MLRRWRPVVCFDRQFLVLGRPASRGARGMGWVHGVHEHDGLVRRQGIHQFPVELDERALLVFVEMARNDLGLAIFEPEAMQKRDQSRAAVIFHPKLRSDPGADLTRRARRDRADPRDELRLLRVAQNASAAAGLKPHQRLSASLGKRAMPPTDRVVVQQKNLRHLLAAQAIVEQHEPIGATSQPMRHRPVERQRDQRGTCISRQEARANRCPQTGIQISALDNGVSRFQRVEYTIAGARTRALTGARPTPLQSRRAPRSHGPGRIPLKFRGALSIGASSWRATGPSSVGEQRTTLW